MRSQKSGRCAQAKGEVWEDVVVDVIVPIFNEGREEGERYSFRAFQDLIATAKGEAEPDPFAEVSDPNPLRSDKPQRRDPERKRQQTTESKQRTRAVREARATANGAAPRVDVVIEEDECQKLTSDTGPLTNAQKQARKNAKKRKSDKPPLRPIADSYGSAPLTGAEKSRLQEDPEAGAHGRTRPRGEVSSLRVGGRMIFCELTEFSPTSENLIFRLQRPPRH